VAAHWNWTVDPGNVEPGVGVVMTAGAATASVATLLVASVTRVLAGGPLIDLAPARADASRAMATPAAMVAAISSRDSTA
jgi:hypothetical protein